ncbi:sensor histidine kinase [Lichenihabitans psoromatis]|uniref:sensor histidine kinase n=1 Tax=Lichenihabitans psoromatis TaxID=2528642 RepID=UPI001FE06C17|nr:PAS domain-containing sensor histidine kinase [Lichenihabitans psoromatis]
MGFGKRLGVAISVQARGSGCSADPRRPASRSRLRHGAAPATPVGAAAPIVSRIGQAALILILLSGPGSAADIRLMSLGSMLDHGESAGLAIIVALVLIATVVALLHLTARRRWAEREQQMTAELAEARAKVDRAQVFMTAEPQIVVAWRSATSEPEIEGDLSLVADALVARRILGFGTWLPPATAQSLEHAVDHLRARGEGFRMAVLTVAGRHLEIEGRAVGGRAILRIRDVSGDRLELTRLRDRHGQVLDEIEALRQMLDIIPDPAWMRNEAGRLSWVNKAYGKAVEAKDPTDAVVRSLELLDQSARATADATRATGTAWIARSHAVVAGERHLLHVIDVPSAKCSAGIAIDLSELESARSELERQMTSHSRTLDQLSTAVAIFDRSKKLVFHNSAYRDLWSLDAAFLDSQPLDGEILDRLRAEGRLPEQADYRAWKASVLAAYQAVEPSETAWYLPGGRTLRAVTNPNPNGGITYLFDDVTERYHLESKYNALIRVQGETLDTLKEAVAVFGTDGRLKLFNPAFAEIWRLDSATLLERPHIDEIAGLCGPLCGDGTAWTAMRTIVAGLEDERRGFEQRLQRRDGTILDYAAAPLPDGATLLTFTNVTAGVNVERALKERNQALIDAEKIRNDFVHHVSYELRSPLTNIIGFVQLLGDRSVGSLNAKQLEYAGYVTKSSSALLAIINDILDLATIDIDAMELSVGDVDIRQIMDEASEGVQDRLSDAGITLQIVAREGIGVFEADGQRVRQILFNLLSNAIGFSSAGQTVTLAAMRRQDQVVFKVTDEGRGMSSDMLDRVFDRFESDTIGSRHRGVGLGLSIVRAFVELHGGQVLIDSALGEGTTVTCIFQAQAIESDAMLPTSLRSH